MQSEEAVRGFVGSVGEGVPAAEEGGDPRRMMRLVLQTMTVGAIIHDLTVSDTLFLVDLPEDDTAQL